MASRWSPAFVITLAALGSASCKKKPAEQTAPQKAEPTPAPATASAAPSASAVDPLTLRRRTVREKIPPVKTAKIELDWARAQRLNGKDADGRWIYAGKDGSCYVKILNEAHQNPPGVHNDDMEHTKKPVDCPETMLDTAFDSCLDHQLIRADKDKNDCYCDRHGNPPPPPSYAECPKPKP